MGEIERLSFGIILLNTKTQRHDVLLQLTEDTESSKAAFNKVHKVLYRTQSYRVIRCRVGVGLLPLKAKSEGTAKEERRKSEGRAKGGGRSGASRLKNLKNKGLKWLREINETKSIKVLLADGKGKC